MYVDLNLLVGVMTFTFSPLHCFYATIVEGGAADRRRRPFLVVYNVMFIISVKCVMAAPGRQCLEQSPCTSTSARRSSDSRMYEYRATQELSG